MQLTRDEKHQSRDTVSLAHGTIGTKRVGLPSYAVLSEGLQLEILGHTCHSGRR